MTDPLVAAARAAIVRGSNSFALASRLFDPVTRDRATLLYAWCRHADDVIDGQVDGFGRVAGEGTPAERLERLEAATRRALRLPPVPGHAGAGQHLPVRETPGRGAGTTVDAGLRQHDGGLGEGTIAFAALARVAAET
ncbi:MAG: squalene/phytoene synthase family protein, partial [Sphingomonadaceae bacterium]|nr:squalene/phytoene synthase family protein [Sphingomonadaceae bacterium]